MSSTLGMSHPYIKAAKRKPEYCEYYRDHLAVVLEIPRLKMFEAETQGNPLSMSHQNLSF